MNVLILSFARVFFSNCNNKSVYSTFHRIVSELLIARTNKHIIFYLLFISLRNDPDTVVSNFNNLSQPYTKASIQSFISANFYSNQADVQPYIPPDFPTILPFSSKITNQNLQNFTQQVHDLWKTLCRTFNHSSSCANCFTSLATNYPFVVAGERFGEYYYWDSYWIIKGLISSGMLDTATKMTYNFRDMINSYGFILNGARIYYTSRSQPPLFTQMVSDVYQALVANSSTNATSYLQSVYSAMITEYTQFWMQQRVQNYNNYTLNHYSSSQFSPRPESYLEDYNRVQSLNLTVEQAQIMYQNLGAGAETGWDYSSRWFNDIYNEDTVDVLNLVEADLNLILYKNEKTIAQFAKILNDSPNFTYFSQQAALRQEAVYRTIQDKKDFTWKDFNLTSKNNTERYYAINFMGLWAMGSELSEQVVNKILQVVDEINDFPGGVPTSAYKTGQQWDFPNSWPPEMGFLILGLLNTNNSAAIDSAHQLIQKYVLNCYCGFQKSLATYGTGYMFEKYDVLDIGSTGQGGEYQPQKGFGWQLI